MRGDFFEYTPRFILLFHGNYRLRLSGVSDAMRRRLHLLPFRHKPAKVDKYLIDKFRAELPGIMAMAVEDV
jgi:putative DNA primase/helicase